MRLHDDQLKDISARFQAEMKKGLSAESNAAAAVKMLPTHVRSTPDGTGHSHRWFSNFFGMLLQKYATRIYIYRYSAKQMIYLCLSLSFAEKGQFLALDLGGSKFKVLQVKVREGMGIRRGGVEMEEKIYPIPKELLSGRGTEVRMRGRERGWGGGTGDMDRDISGGGGIEEGYHLFLHRLSAAI